MRAVTLLTVKSYFAPVEAILDVTDRYIGVAGYSAKNRGALAGSTKRV